MIDQAIQLLNALDEARSGLSRLRIAAGNFYRECGMKDQCKELAELSATDLMRVVGRDAHLITMAAREQDDKA